MNIFIVKNKTWQKPFDDKYLEYDMDTSRYIITDQAIKDFTGYNMQEFAGDPTMSLHKRREFSEDVYMEVEKYSTMASYAIKEYFMSNLLEARGSILQVLIAQARYSIRSGGNFFKDQHGLNTGKGITLNTAGYSIGERVKDILEGTGLLYRGYLVLLETEFEKGVDY